MLVCEICAPARCRGIEALKFRICNPRVALKADTGKLKSADEIVTVPGSEVGKLAMN